jgi:RHH-type transcriptional regulator, proline utilization regulon repressor / proline dehydrogenase / delta 1-pyrroline-5-carboxylate dehydrogenase
MTPFVSEPLTDFSLAENRQAMQSALEGVRREFGRTWPLVINGREVRTEQTIESVNPSRLSEVVGRACRAEPEHVEQAVAAAKAAFPAWAARTARERADRLRAAADIMRRRRFELAAWIIHEVGKPWREADADVAEAIDFCRFYSAEMERLEARPRRRDFPGEENSYVYQPRGVAAVISPWNFPLAILTGMSSAALVAGNTVIMKPAEQSPVVAARLMGILAEAGIPPGVANYLPGEGETIGAALVEHPGVSIIAFTGSREVGVQIYGRAAQWKPGQPALKRVIAEMGGKNAIIIDADADLDEAVAGVAASAFGYGGQKCSACSRVIVLESAHPLFVERLIEAARSVPVGPADDPRTVVGPLIDDASRRKTQRYVELGAREGRLVYRADLGDLADRGYFVPPVIIDEVRPEARVAQEEIFGPVLAVIVAGSFDEALRVANNTDYALTGGLYSRSPAHLEQAKREFNVGNLYINRGITGALVDRQPFGGFKMSGVGSKAGGPDYLLQFLEPRTITENTLRHGFAPVDTPQREAESPTAPTAGT